MPGSTAAAGHVAQLPRDSQRDECRSPTPWCFPLAPEGSPQSQADPASESNQHLGRFAKAEIAAPAQHIPSQFFHCRLDADALGPSRDVSPGGGISLDGTRWVACRPNFFLYVGVLSRLFRRLVLEKLAAAHAVGALQFFGKHASLTNARAFAAYLAPLRNSEWVVYSKRPFGGPKQVLRYLARYTHRVAISNRRLVALNDNGVTFKWKDYRIEGPERYKVMT